MKKRSKTINYGDRIFARVTRNGRTVLNYVTDTVANITELLGELRRLMKDFQGLVILHIRNYHQGWGEERPLMLYASKIQSWPSIAPEYAEKYETQKEQRLMYSPWEVH